MTGRIVCDHPRIVLHEDAPIAPRHYHSVMLTTAEYIGCFTAPAAYQADIDEYLNHKKRLYFMAITEGGRKVRVVSVSLCGSVMAFTPRSVERVMLEYRSAAARCEEAGKIAEAMGLHAGEDAEEG